MTQPWQLYDDLIKGIAPHLTVSDYQAGPCWSRLTSSEGGTGVAMAMPEQTRPPVNAGSLIGRPLREAALCVKSWDFLEASIGLAAINSYYNHPTRAEGCGAVHPVVTEQRRESFDIYYEETAGKKVAVVGHFPFIEKRFSGHCALSILERSPSPGDYPDSACEYILAEQEYVFITGCTLVNKTLPRLLTLSANAKVVLVGPSTPLAPVLFSHGLFGLSGFVVTAPETLVDVLRGPGSMGLFDCGRMVDQLCTD